MTCFVLIHILYQILIQPCLLSLVLKCVLMHQFSKNCPEKYFLNTFIVYLFNIYDIQCLIADFGATVTTWFDNNQVNIFRTKACQSRKNCDIEALQHCWNGG